MRSLASPLSTVLQPRLTSASSISAICFLPGASIFRRELRRLAVRASDLKLLDLEFSLELDDRVEDALHDVAIDEMALRLDDLRNRSILVFHASLIG